MKKLVFLCCLLMAAAPIVNAQLETAKWYFGNSAALSFTTGVPVSLAGSAMFTGEGSASIADAAGNTLFYTSGNTVWNRNNLVMPNGGGLNGSSISAQSAVIIRQPGSANLYYVFTMRNWTDAGNGAHYSIVDMSLAGGLGDVTVKNQLIYGNTRESLTGICHANGTDAWVVIHDMFTNEFHSYLLTSAGLNLTPVISAVGGVYSGGNRYGCLKSSPDGTRLAYALGGSTVTETTQIFDFDRSTGVVSNPITLNTANNYFNAYGVEFSPNGQVLYVCEFNGTTIQQYNLAAGTPAAVIASRTIVSNGTGSTKSNLQLAPNNKIYVSLNIQSNLGVIDNPNVVGVGCNYLNNFVPLAIGSCRLGLPNFMPCLVVILPAEWEYFHAHPSDGYVELSWGLANPEDFASFTVERMHSEEEGFTRIGLSTLPARGSRTFEALDPSPQEGTNAYRVRAETHDGQVQFSETRMVQYRLGEPVPAISPNPLDDGRQLSVAVHARMGDVTVEIHDLQGKQLTSKTFPSTDGALLLDLQALPQGIYLLRVNPTLGWATTHRIVLP